MRNKEDFMALVKERAAAQRQAALLAARRRKMIFSGVAALVLCLAILPIAFGWLPMLLKQTIASNNAGKPLISDLAADEMAPSPEFHPGETGAHPNYSGGKNTEPEENSPTDPSPLQPPGFIASDPYADLTASSPAELLSRLGDGTSDLSDTSTALLTAFLQDERLTLSDGRSPFCALYLGEDGYFMLKLTWTGDNAFRFTLRFNDDPIFTKEWLRENYLPMEAEFPLYRHPSPSNEFYRAYLSDLLLAEIEFSKDHTDVPSTLAHLTELCKAFCNTP